MRYQVIVPPDVMAAARTARPGTSTCGLVRAGLAMLAGWDSAAVDQAAAPRKRTGRPRKNPTSTRQDSAPAGT